MAHLYGMGMSFERIEFVIGVDWKVRKFNRITQRIDGTPTMIKPFFIAES